MRMLTLATTLLLVPFVIDSARAEDAAGLAKSLVFHAAFDGSADADFAKGDSKIYTAKTLKRESVEAGLHSEAVRLSKQGQFGGSLEFLKKSKKIVFFNGQGNLPAVKPALSGSYSFWLKLTPDKDLPAGYVDPLQITDKKWNDASFFVDFTKENPRKFRLGVFSDFDFWNPKNRKWEMIPESERPLVTVDKPPFTNQKWTHVAITFSDINTDKEARVALYLNGKKQGEVRGKQQINWGKDRLAIMLGIYYRGGMDDFAVFSKPLTSGEVKTLYSLPQGVRSLHSPK